MQPLLLFQGSPGTSSWRRPHGIVCLVFGAAPLGLLGLPRALLVVAQTVPQNGEPRDFQRTVPQGEFQSPELHGVPCT